MKDFAFLFRGGQAPETPAAMEAEMKKWLAWSEQLRAKGT